METPAGRRPEKLAGEPLISVLIAFIRLYQRYSRLTPPVCRFRPTCSEYALAALEAHGLARGLWLAVRRLSKCHPFHPGGYDPVR